MIMITGFELCETYNVDVEKLTELWLTFCVNNNSDIDPTLSTLVKMENAILKKDCKSHDLITEDNENKIQSTMDKQEFNVKRDTYPLISCIKLSSFSHVDKY